MNAGNNHHASLHDPRPFLDISNFAKSSHFSDHEFSMDYPLLPLTSSFHTNTRQQHFVVKAKFVTAEHGDSSNKISKRHSCVSTKKAFVFSEPVDNGQWYPLSLCFLFYRNRCDDHETTLQVFGETSRYDLGCGIDDAGLERCCWWADSNSDYQSWFL